MVAIRSVGECRDQNRQLSRAGKIAIPAVEKTHIRHRNPMLVRRLVRNNASFALRPLKATELVALWKSSRSVQVCGLGSIETCATLPLACLLVNRYGVSLPLPLSEEHIEFQHEEGGAANAHECNWSDNNKVRSTASIIGKPLQGFGLKFVQNATRHQQICTSKFWIPVFSVKLFGGDSRKKKEVHAGEIQIFGTD
jgi:hypothetical protein